jgi:hypothetical protein
MNRWDEEGSDPDQEFWDAVLRYGRGEASPEQPSFPDPSSQTQADPPGQDLSLGSLRLRFSLPP